jgi:RNA polymerase sigma factor (sigma-70 family)
MSETEILDGCLRRDAVAQHQLYQWLKCQLFGVCLRYARDRPEAQDMLQDAFVTIFRDLAQYKGNGQLEAWTRRVTVRVALQHLRRRNPLRWAETVDDQPLPPVLPDTELNTEAILGMVQLLPDGYRTVFNLRCMEAFSFQEIAQELSIAESSVRSQYSRACHQLRGMIEKNLFITR